MVLGRRKVPVGCGHRDVGWLAALPMEMSTTGLEEQRHPARAGFTCCHPLPTCRWVPRDMLSPGLGLPIPECSL